MARGEQGAEMTYQVALGKELAVFILSVDQDGESVTVGVVLGRVDAGAFTLDNVNQFGFDLFGQHAEAAIGHTGHVVGKEGNLGGEAALAPLFDQVAHTLAFFCGVEAE